MDVQFSSEQEQFREVVQRFLRDTSPPQEVRRLISTADGFDRGVWQRMNNELGLAGIHVEEEHGGLGFGAVELGIVLEEMGRALYCGPYFGSAVLAAAAIVHGGSAADKRTLLPAIASGERIASLAVAEADGCWDVGAVRLTAQHTADGLVLNGTKHFVLDGQLADLIVVAARTPGSVGDRGVSLCVVDGGCAGLERHALETLDQTRKLAVLSFDNVIASPLGEPEQGAAPLARALDEAAIALAAEMVGAAQTLLDSAVEYAGLRMQFGRVIGSFQAIKHKCADLLLEIELARSGAYYASAALAAGDARVRELAALAKAVAADACMHAAAECIQIHGGIGFTWDHDTHLWYRRAKASEVLLGAPAWHRERYIQALEQNA